MVSLDCNSIAKTETCLVNPLATTKSSRVFSFLSVSKGSSALLPSVERELRTTNCAILCLTCLSREIVQRVSGKARDSSSEIVDKFGMQ